VSTGTILQKRIDQPNIPSQVHQAMLRQFEPGEVMNLRWNKWWRLNYHGGEYHFTGGIWVRSYHQLAAEWRKAD